MDTRLNETKKTPTARAKRPPQSPTLQSADFERLLSDFSAALVRVSAADIDNEIERWLEQIVLAMNVDRCTVVQVDPADGGIYNTHQWGRPGVLTPNRGRRERETGFPWLPRQDSLRQTARNLTPGRTPPGSEPGSAPKRVSQGPSRTLRSR